MAKGFKHGSGGASLNFKVVAYATEELLNAAKPGENTIGVISEKVTGYYFSATQPENMAEYEVWFPTSNSSGVAFNALRRNTIEVCPNSAKQYVNGALVDVVAKTYQDEKWVAWWSGDLYDNGNEYTEYTGGWSTFQQANQNFDDAACSKENGKLTLQTTGQRCAVAYGTVNAIDLTNYSAIEFTTEAIYTECAFAVSEMRDSTSSDNKAAHIVPTEAGVHSLDVSTLEGSYYIWFGNWTMESSILGAAVTKVRLVS